MSLRDGPFHPLRIEAVRCEMGTVKEHLDAFVRAFVRREARARAAHILFRLAPKRPDRLGDLCKLLDERYTSPPQDLALPRSLPRVGVFFAGGQEAWMMSLDDATVVSDWLCRDAVWSAVAGSYAAFLSHEAAQWVCYRPSVAKSAKPA